MNLSLVKITIYIYIYIYCIEREKKSGEEVRCSCQAWRAGHGKGSTVSATELGFGISTTTNGDSCDGGRRRETRLVGRQFSSLSSFLVS